MKKRFLSLFLTALLVISLLPTTVFAEGNDFTITNGTPQSDSAKNHGYITIDKTAAAHGDTVTITVNPEDGYKLKSLTCTPTVTINTIADVLATVAGFPEDTSGGHRPAVPSDAWYNENNGCVFTYTSNNSNYIILRSGSAFKMTEATTAVTKGENCYTASISNGTLKFNMKDGTLISIEHSATDDANKKYDGTYTSASISPADLEPIIPAKQTDGTYQFIMAANAVTVAAEFEEIPAHTHTFTYTASDNTITATCVNDDCDLTDKKVTLTLTESYYEYEGRAMTVDFIYGEPEAWTGAGLELPTITYAAKSGSSLTNDKAVDAGSYTASITVDSDKTASIDFTINKATPYIQTIPTSVEIDYGQKLADSTLAGGYVQFSSSDNTQVGGLFEWKEPDTVPAIADSNVTLYDVIFTPADEKNYNTVSCQVTITVMHTHNPVLVNGQAPEVGTAGWKDYYECICGERYEDAGGSVLISDLDVWKAEGGNGYLAPLAPVKYTVTFDMGGHGAQIDPKTVEAGSKVTKPDDPTADGWTFGGWYVDTDFSAMFDFNTAINANTTVYAKWTENTIPQPPVYTIIVGADSEWTEGEKNGLLITSDAPFDKFDSVKVDGSTIASTNYAAEEGSTKITLAPAYLKTLSVGTHSIEIVSNDGGASTNFTIKATVPPAPIYYTVTFNMNGHGSQVNAQTVKSGSKATKPDDPKASGYAFGGWYADAAFSTKFDFNTAITANTTVYAKWMKNSADPTGPQTGDNSHMFLWITLLLVSGGVFVGTTVYGKKRKRAE